MPCREPSGQRGPASHQALPLTPRRVQLALGRRTGPRGLGAGKPFLPKGRLPWSSVCGLVFPALVCLSLLHGVARAELSCGVQGPSLAHFVPFLPAQAPGGLPCHLLSPATLY